MGVKKGLKKDAQATFERTCPTTGERHRWTVHGGLGSNIQAVALVQCPDCGQTDSVASFMLEEYEGWPMPDAEPPANDVAEDDADGEQ